MADLVEVDARNPKKTIYVKRELGVDVSIANKS